VTEPLILTHEEEESFEILHNIMPMENHNKKKEPEMSFKAEINEWSTCKSDEYKEIKSPEFGSNKVQSPENLEKDTQGFFLESPNESNQRILFGL